MQTSSTEVIMRDDSSGTMPGDMSETISDHSASYSAAVKSTKDSVHEKEASTVGFEEVRNKRYKKQKAKSITGCRPRSDTVSLQGVRKKAVICVSRLHKDTSAEAVTAFLTSNGIKVNSCFNVGSHHSQVKPDTDTSANAKSSNSDTDTEASSQDVPTKPKFRNYCTMRICVFDADVDKLMCPELWPDGVSVRPWAFKKRQ